MKGRERERREGGREGGEREREREEGGRERKNICKRRDKASNNILGLGCRNSLVFD